MNAQRKTSLPDQIARLYPTTLRQTALSVEMDEAVERRLADKLAGPVYNPPYPDAVTDELAWHLPKYLREDASLRSDHEVEIPGRALFTLDFMAEVILDGDADHSDGIVHSYDPGGPYRVAFETGGPRRLRDHDRRLCRDATLLDSGKVDVIYRLRGSDLLGRMDDVLYLIAQWDPELFSERGRINLETLASPEARATEVYDDQASVLVSYDTVGTSSPHDALWHAANDACPHILVRRLARSTPGVWRPYSTFPSTS